MRGGRDVPLVSPFSQPARVTQHMPLVTWMIVLAGRVSAQSQVTCTAHMIPDGLRWHGSRGHFSLIEEMETTAFGPVYK